MDHTEKKIIKKRKTNNDENIEEPRIKKDKTIKNVFKEPNSKDKTPKKKVGIIKQKIPNNPESLVATENEYIFDQNTQSSDDKSKEEYVNTEIWQEVDMLSYLEKIPHSLAKNFVGMLNEGCTLPFIARYRKGMIDNLMPDRYATYNISFFHPISFIHGIV